MIHNKLISSADFRSMRAGRKHMIHTGLFVVIAGYLLHVERDDTTKTACVHVTPLRGRKLSDLRGQTREAVKAAAKLLAERARRLLVGWTVKEFS